MFSKLKSFCKKHREIIAYLIFGVITTVASLGAWYSTMKLGVLFLSDEQGNPTTLLDAIGSTVQWVVGVLVAFVTNKKWVFCVSDTTKKESATELSKFAAGRLATLGLDTVLTFGTVWLLNALDYVPFTIILAFTADLWSKIVSSVVVIITNYVISKFIVFKKK